MRNALVFLVAFVVVLALFAWLPEPPPEIGTALTLYP